MANDARAMATAGSEDAPLAGDLVASRLEGRGLFLRTGPFVVKLRSKLPEIAASIATLYPGHLIADAPDFADFHVGIRRVPGPRGYVRPRVVFELDGERVFEPFPRREAAALLEWGLNWAISTYANQYLLIHAACVEKDGKAAIMPGGPGQGKSTLCAALVNRGWRLLSDELAIIDVADGTLVPLCRPISLKNASIEAIHALVPQAVFGTAINDTRKGTLALLKPPADSIRRMTERAAARYIVIPSFSAGAVATARERSRGSTMMTLAENAFNYQLHGIGGFDRLAALAESCRCVDLVYGDLDQAVAAMQAFWLEGP
jgi:HprK-related kinase A